MFYLFKFWQNIDPCVEAEAVCNEIQRADLFPGYNCNEVDFDFEDNSCRIDTNIAGKR